MQPPEVVVRVGKIRPFCERSPVCCHRPIRLIRIGFLKAKPAEIPVECARDPDASASRAKLPAHQIAHEATITGGSDNTAAPRVCDHKPWVGVRQKSFP